MGGAQRRVGLATDAYSGWVGVIGKDEGRKRSREEGEGGITFRTKFPSSSAAFRKMQK